MEENHLPGQTHSNLGYQPEIESLDCHLTQCISTSKHSVSIGIHTETCLEPDAELSLSKAVRSSSSFTADLTGRRGEMFEFLAFL